MEKLSQITDSTRLPVFIEILPFLMDHRFEGSAVLPAVEAMNLLAKSTFSHIPDMDTGFIGSARFDKFLYLSADTSHISAFNELEPIGQIGSDEENGIRSTLVTRTTSKTHGISRVKKHVTRNAQPVSLK